MEGREHQRVRALPVGQRPTALALSADSGTAYLGLADGQVGRVRFEPGGVSDILGKHPAPVTALALAENEAFVFTGASDGTFALWDCEHKKSVFARDGKSGAIKALAVSASGRHGATVDQDGKLRLLDLRNGQTIRSIDAHDGEATAVIFSRCGAYLLSGGSDARVRLWDAWTGTEENVIETQGARVVGVAMNIDRSLVVTASGRHVEFWNLGSGQRLAEFTAHQEDIEAFAATPDLRHALTSTGGRTSKLWNLSTGQCLRSLRLQAPAALTRDGDIAAAMARNDILELWRVHLDSAPFGAPYYVCRNIDSEGADDPDN